MGHVVRSLLVCSKWKHQCCCLSSFYHHLLNSTTTPLPTTTTITHQPLSLIGIPSSHQNLHSRPHRPKSTKALLPPDLTDTDNDSDSDVKKSRNEKKREARRAVRWAMDLAAFSVPQLKRIVRVASLEPEVMDALMVVKRLGRDVREGKRRQFNYIGRLLRGVEQELMEGLIQATKDGDQSKFQSLSGSEALVIEDDEESEDSEYEYEEEVSDDYIHIATRWFDGLIDKDMDITNEIYSIRTVEFDRQELRRLVRDVYFAQNDLVTPEENEGEVDAAALRRAKKSLTRFLYALAKQLPTE